MNKGVSPDHRKPAKKRVALPGIGSAAPATIWGGGEGSLVCTRVSREGQKRGWGGFCLEEMKAACSPRPKGECKGKQPSRSVGALDLFTEADEPETQDGRREGGGKAATDRAQGPGATTARESGKGDTDVRMPTGRRHTVSRRSWCGLRDTAGR